MARTDTVMISSDALGSTRLAQVSSDAERLYWRLHMATDKYGCMPGDTWNVYSQAAVIRGWTPERVEAAMDELINGPNHDATTAEPRWNHLVTTYECENGRIWLQIADYDEYQTHAYKRNRGKRKTPPPPNHDATTVEPRSGERGNAPTTTPTSTTTSTTTTTTTPTSTTPANLELIDEIVRRVVSCMEVNEKQLRNDLDLMLSRSGYPNDVWVAAAGQLVQKYKRGGSLKNPGAVVHWLAQAAKGISENPGQLDARNVDPDEARAKRVRARLDALDAAEREGGVA